MDNGPQIRVIRGLEELRELIDELGSFPQQEKSSLISLEEKQERMREICAVTYEIVRGNDQATDGDQMEIGYYMRSCAEGLTSDYWKESCVSILLLESIIMYLKRRQKEDPKAFEQELVDCVDVCYEHQWETSTKRDKEHYKSESGAE